MMEIAATHHLAFSNNVFTDVIRESSFVKQKAYQVFKQASDDCNFLSSSMKQIEAQAKVLTKKRDAALKKNGPYFVDPKLVQELEALGKKHESAKAQALQLEGLDGVHAGYSVYPTDQLWHQQGIVFGKSGLPWSLHQQKPGRYDLPNAHAANQSMVRVDINESLGDREARDLIQAIAKVAKFYGT